MRSALRTFTQAVLVTTSIVCGIMAFRAGKVNLHLVFLSIQSTLFGIWFWVVTQ